ncbi:magnesium-protoporphyrin O-methyltransferase [Isoptericola sp. CG 20/1183]|uniref:Magnesium-protoporphyrin O-methyltransferase n=1 Tax=Isoptericola halotolerans TaxID=300560 RepID=A0ABX5EF10_9MICO|nr:MULTISPECIES: methyltransferase domain-containing protein [Isoptericola]PRZ05206.1 magnesium-protoporphyrin O-methyltransferase [Isoptericola halotolerans]PRZ05944.1 magnesium-protoporphyrin O-methyltransferase [Isoptericola sp. CG 20/1183]
MSSCCQPEPQGYDRVFDSRAARVAARRYRRSGLTVLPRRTVELYRAGVLSGSTLLEVGSGVGDFSLEMLRAGMRHATCVDLSGAYDDAARGLAVEAGLADRVTRATGDIVTRAELVGPADVVALHSVVCCYPDARRLLTAAASKARRHLVVSYPRDSWAVRAWAPLVNVYPRLRGSDWRFVVHPSSVVHDAVAAAGFVVAHAERLRFDEHLVLTRR